MSKQLVERYELMRKEAIKKLIEETPLSELPLENPIRHLPLAKAYPEKHDWEAKLDFLRRLDEYPIEVGRIINEEFKWDWRAKRIHIMYLDHALCRKNNFATSYGKKIILEWKTWEITFKDRLKYKYTWKFCSKCNKLFLAHHEEESGLF